MQNIKLAIRQLLKQKAFATINIVGLTLALGVSLVVTLFVLHHYSYDKNVSHGERSYRINMAMKQGTYRALSFPAFDKALQHHRMVEDYTVFYTYDQSFSISAGEATIPINNPLYVDTSFVSYFNISLKMGDAKDLADPNTVLITEEMYNTFFKCENPIGQSIRLTYDTEVPDGNRSCTIVGVIAANNKLSHLKYDLIHSKSGYFEKKNSDIEKRKVFGASVYLTLKPNILASDFEDQIIEMLRPVLPDNDMSGPPLASIPPLSAFSYQLQALKDIHFTTGIAREMSTGISRSHLNILLIIGMLLFLTATFNFLIMNVARAKGRMKQTMIIRFLGGTKLSIFTVTLFEVIVLVFMASTLAILGIYFLNPIIASSFLNHWTIDMRSPIFWIILSLLLFVLIIIASLGSSTRLLSMRNSMSSNKGVVPLIVFQFVVVIILTSYSLLLNKQIQYIRDKDLGFDAENVMIFRTPARKPNVRVFKEQVAQIPGVTKVGVAHHYPGYPMQDINFQSTKGLYPMTTALLNMDALDVLNIEIVEQFSSSDHNTNFINESCYHALRQEFTREEIISGAFNPEFNLEENPGMITFKVHGIIKDFHYASLYNPIGNFLFFVYNPQRSNFRFLLVKCNQANVAQVKKEVMAIASSVYGVDNVEPLFLDEELNREYQSEELLLSVTSLFALLTILIACMGLLAFTQYTTQQRTREIGIRKVNGATISEILLMLNKDFIKWVAIAFVIAVPIAYYAMSKWLENFAYKTELSWWIFALAGVLALGIALLTVSWQSWRAARRNPVESLRYE